MVRNPQPSADPESAKRFRTDHLRGELGPKSIRGGLTILVARVGQFVVNVGSLAILARVLMPEDFGLIAMVAAWVNLPRLFLSLGLSSATIQKAELSSEQVSTLFWFNVVTGMGLALVSVSLAPVIAVLFGDPRVTMVLVALSIGLVILGFETQPRAILLREMKYRAIAGIDLLAPILGSAVGIGAAVSGAGYWSLVFAQLVTQLASTAGCWAACDWRPGTRAGWADVRALLAFGGHLTVFRFANYLARTADDVLLGRFAGAATLGLYSRAWKLVQLPVSEIALPSASVVVPALSRLQGDHRAFRTYYLNALRVVTGLGMPAVVCLFVLADEVILMVLGPNWSEAANLFRLLAPAAFIETFNTAGNWVCLATARTDRMARWQAFATTVTLVGFLVGIQWGAEGVAIALSGTTLVLRYPSLRYLLRGSPITTRQLAGTMARPAVGSIIAGAVLWMGLQSGLFPSHTLLRLITATGAYSLLYLFAWLAGPGHIRSRAEVVGLLRIIRRSAGGRGPDDVRG